MSGATGIIRGGSFRPEFVDDDTGHDAISLGSNLYGL